MVNKHGLNMIETPKIYGIIQPKKLDLIFQHIVIEAANKARNDVNGTIQLRNFFAIRTEII